MGYEQRVSGPEGSTFLLRDITSDSSPCWDAFLDGEDYTNPHSGLSSRRWLRHDGRALSFYEDHCDILETEFPSRDEVLEAIARFTRHEHPPEDW